MKESCQQSIFVKVGSSIFITSDFCRMFSCNKGLHAGPWRRDSRERRDTSSSERFLGTEAMFRGKRRVTLAGRLSSSTDEGYRRLDPLPDRVQGRRIVVSPKIDDEKGKGTL